MKRILHLFMLCLMSIIGATTVKANPITSAGDLSNTAVYTIRTNDRGWIVYDATNAPTTACSTGRFGITPDATNPNHQWAFLTTEKGIYLYNVGAKKFLYKSGGYTEFSDAPLGDDVNILASTGGNKDSYPTVIAFGSNQMGISNSYGSGGVITFYNDLADSGNMVAIEAVDGVVFDPTEALETIENVKPVLIIKINEFKTTVAGVKAFLYAEATLTDANSAIEAAQAVVDNAESTNEEEQAALDALTEAIAAFQPDAEAYEKYAELGNYIGQNANSWAEAMHAAMHGLITKPEQITSNSVSTREGSNGPTVMLIDGDLSTYYHGGYGNELVSDVNYLQVSLDAPAGDVWFYMNKRSSNDNNRPVNITVSGSTDGVTFTEIQTFDWNMALAGPATAWGVVNGGEYTTLRFAVNKTNTGTKFFTASEFQIHALPTGETESAVVDLVDSYFGIETAENLDEAYNKMQTIIDALDPKLSVEFSLGTRANTLENGKKYLIFNTAYNGTQNRTGFLHTGNGTGFGLSQMLPSEMSLARTSGLKYIWTIETTDEANVFYIKNNEGKYIDNKGKVSEAAYKFTIEEWTKSTVTRGGANSLAEDETTVVANANITADNKVWTVSTEATGNDKCWNGNVGSFTTWSAAHPYAFYEVNYAIEMEAEPASTSTVVSKLDPVTLTFTNFEEVAVNPSVAQGYTISKDGEAPASVETALFVAENNTVKFGQGSEGTLMPIATEPGVYTITIPAGKFLLSSYDLPSEEITLTYTVEKATEYTFTPEAGNYETLPAEVTVNYTNVINSVTSVTIDALDIDGVAQDQFVVSADSITNIDGVVTINVDSEAIDSCDTYTMTITVVDRFGETVTSEVTYTTIKATESKATPEGGNYETLPTEVTIEFTNKIESVTSVTVDATGADGIAKEQIVIADEAITQGTRNIVIAVSEDDLYGCNKYTLTYTVVDRFGETITGTVTYTADITTGIATITSNGNNVVIYDITGRKVKTVAPSKIYIKNNKKYIAK